MQQPGGRLMRARQFNSSWSAASATALVDHSFPSPNEGAGIGPSQFGSKLLEGTRLCIPACTQCAVQGPPLSQVGGMAAQG